MKIGSTDFQFGKRTYIMGILNVTPDSFSDGGNFNGVRTAVEQAKRMADEGADIIDIGGESTRPGHTPVPAALELERVLPVIKEVRAAVEVPLSIDTSKAEVAEEALKAGAVMINDVWGFRRDPRMATVAAEYDAVCCLMHNKEKAEYQDLCAEIEEGLRQSLRIAREAGVDDSRIILDPGIGFGKTPEHNLVVMRNLRRFVGIGFPLLIGASRKSMIGKVLDLPVQQRLEGTIATTVLGVAQGVDIVRVHDVEANLRAAAMADAIIRVKE